MLTKPFSIVYFFFLCLLATGQEQPPIQVFNPSQYGAENQNWGISQSEEKNIYIANNIGLLVFNGATWELYDSPNETIIRSVTVIDNLIYTGCYREFGYWTKNNVGTLDYTSLSTKLNISFLEDEEIWNILQVEDFILFQSLQRIYIYNKKKQTYAIINSDQVIYKMFKIKRSIYFQKVKEGVFEIVNGEAKLVSNDPVLKDNLLVNIFSHQDHLLFLTEDNGFYKYKDNTFTKWDIAANKLLLNNRIYRSIQLKDQSYILGSISNGILYLTPEGEIKHHINQTNGLSNNTVLSLFEDVDQNVWLGLENGINCINIKSPFSVYKGQNGEIGSVNTSLVYQNMLYLGTNQGLFYKEMNTNSKFSLIPGTQGAVWYLKNINNTLFCGHNNGTFIINGTQAKMIYDEQGTWIIKTIPQNDALLLQGNYDGLSIIENKNGEWLFRNKIEGFDISTRFFEMLGSRDVLMSHEYKGVFKIKFDTNYTKAVSVEMDTSVAKGLKSSTIKYHNDIIYTYHDGVFKYNKTKNTFEKDSILSQFFLKTNYSSGKLVYTEETSTLWAFSSDHISYLSPFNLSDSYKINRIYLPNAIRNDVSGYENITHLYSNTYLYGNSLGFMTIDLDQLKYNPPRVYLNHVSSSHYANGFKSKLLNTSAKGILGNTENNMEFIFSVPQYNKFFQVEYQYKLEGIYNDWSPWQTTNSLSFENLPDGHYNFQVRARIGNSLSENIETFSFSIAKPWYISTPMLIFYIILLIFISFIIHSFYKRYYKKLRKKLLLKKERELELIELENKQQLMRFNNEKLRQDIEGKNRELGISTMSLIKKNEFLNTIKSELAKVKEAKNLKNVIKIIDKNLNNTDDWNTFEQAFNNADKDFLKKIKSQHPILTSNDLRLCAYLRLNLTSKEIAPLLNISPRSVEVKRYRLRKKLDLAHESSLTDYILEI